jgi:hypothetical protein
MEKANPFVFTSVPEDFSHFCFKQENHKMHNLHKYLSTFAHYKKLVHTSLVYLLHSYFSLISCPGAWSNKIIF